MRQPLFVLGIEIFIAFAVFIFYDTAINAKTVAKNH